MIRRTRIRCGTLASCQYNTPLVYLPGLRKPAVAPLRRRFARPAPGCSRRVLCLLQWMCPPTATSAPQAGRRTRQRSPSPPPSPKLPPSPYGLWRTRRWTGLPSLVRPTRREPLGRTRGSRRAIQGEGVASKPYGAEGRIDEENGVCQYILTRPSPQRATAAGHGRSRSPARGAVALPGRTQRAPVSPRRTQRTAGMGERRNGETAKRHSLQRRARRGRIGERQTAQGQTTERTQRGGFRLRISDCGLGIEPVFVRWRELRRGRRRTATRLRPSGYAGASGSRRDPSAPLRSGRDDNLTTLGETPPRAGKPSTGG